jgi:hypothetical protein
MAMSIYDPCLLITTKKDEFGIVRMQTDDTLILGLEQFDKTKNKELEKANFNAKPKELLSPETPLIFNRCTLTQKGGGGIELCQKEQGKKLEIINANSKDY